MKIYISADMEGVTGVTHSQDVIPGRSQYERFRALLTADVNAAIEGAAQAGATEFLVNEAYDGMRNILLEDLDSRAEVIVGQRKPLSMMQGWSAWMTGASHGRTRTTKRPSRCSSASCGCPAATRTMVRRNREPHFLHRGRLRRREIRGQPARRRSWRRRLSR